MAAGASGGDADGTGGLTYPARPELAERLVSIAVAILLGG
jgi:hypothetical protein